MPTKEMNIYELKKIMRRRESQMKTGRWKRMERELDLRYLTRGWKDGRKGREDRILGALYGTDEAGKPGLDVLKEERARLIKNTNEDSK